MPFKLHAIIETGPIIRGRLTCCGHLVCGFPRRSPLKKQHLRLSPCPQTKSQ